MIELSCFTDKLSIKSNQLVSRLNVEKSKKSIHVITPGFLPNGAIVSMFDEDNHETFSFKENFFANFSPLQWSE